MNDNGYLGPLDPEFVDAMTKFQPDPDQQLSEPIIPINELGITVVEKDPRTGANILQNVQAAIRAGASTIQLVMTTPGGSAIGGRPKAYGKEVREAIRNVAEYNDLNIAGLEMPTSSHTNLSGFDPRSNSFDEGKLHEDMQEVRDAMQFVADVAGGGGVDIWSQEFQRPIFNASWNKEGEYAGDFKLHPKEEKEAIRRLVDSTSGKIIGVVREDQTISTLKWNKNDKGEYIDREGNPVSIKERVPYFDENGKPEIEEKKIDDFQEEADEFSKLPEFRDQNRKVTSEEAYYFAQIQQQVQETKAQSKRWDNDRKERLRLAESTTNQLENLQEQIKEAPKQIQQIQDAINKINNDIREKEQESGNEALIETMKSRRDQAIEAKKGAEENLKEAKNSIDPLKSRIREHQKQADDYRDLIASQELKLRRMEDEQKGIRNIEGYAKERTFDSYAELGIYAMNESKHNRNVKDDKPLYVGPELGWPTAYGGHPEEFIELVQESRKVMAKKLVEQGWLESEAKKKAKMHIKGLFDTSHMGMWLRHFKREEGETEEKHIKRFNVWYNDMVQKLIDSETVGSIQAVNSMSGAHGHLPPSQGIFPVVDAVKKFKESGEWKGFIVSEGHEEEMFEKNRIMLDTWRSMGGHFGRSYSGAQTWGSIGNSYFGKTYSPTFMVGAYSPSNDFKLWTEVPLE